MNLAKLSKFVVDTLGRRRNAHLLDLNQGSETNGEDNTPKLSPEDLPLEADLVTGKDLARRSNEDSGLQSSTDSTKTTNNYNVAIKDYILIENKGFSRL